MTVMGINETSTTWALISYANLTTGELFITLMFVVLGLMILAAALRVPIEYTGIFIAPLLITLAAYDASFIVVVGVGLIYLGLILAKNFFFR